jgi:transposase
MVHRLVGLAFIPNLENKHEINHKDGNKDNNQVDNLEWCTRKENIKHGFETGLFKLKYNEETRLEIINLLKENKLKISEISKITGMSKEMIKIISKSIPEYTFNNKCSYTPDEEFLVINLLLNGHKMTDISKNTNISYGSIKYLNNKLKKGEINIMSNHRNTYQQTYTVSVPKNELLEYVVYNEDLSKTDYKVFLMLLTELNGYSPSKSDKYGENDPKIFTKIDTEQIAKHLDISEKKVKESIKTLKDQGIIEKGNTKNMKNGYRFTF